MRPGGPRSIRPLRRPRAARPCSCGRCAAGLPPPAGMTGASEVPATDSPELALLGLRALKELRHPLTAEGLRRQLGLRYGDVSTLTVARVLRVLGGRVRGEAVLW